MGLSDLKALWFPPNVPGKAAERDTYQGLAQGFIVQSHLLRWWEGDRIGREQCPERDLSPYHGERVSSGVGQMPGICFIFTVPYWELSYTSTSGAWCLSKVPLFLRVGDRAK